MICESLTLSVLCASGNFGSLVTDARMMKMMRRTSSTSVKGVMLIVDMTSSSPELVETAMLRGHKADVVEIGLLCGVENPNDRAVRRLRIRGNRNMDVAPALCRLVHHEINRLVVGAR